MVASTALQMAMPLVLLKPCVHSSPSSDSRGHLLLLCMMVPERLAVTLRTGIAHTSFMSSLEPCYSWLLDQSPHITWVLVRNAEP